MFGVKSVRFLEKIRATVRGEISLFLEEIQDVVQGKNQSVFWKRFRLLFGVKSIRVFKEIQASVRGEISPCFGRDSGCCSG